MRWWCVLVLAAAAGGCGKADGPVPVYPVRGQVLYDGKPAEGVKVYLLPAGGVGDKRVPTNPTGVTGKDGSFALGTYAEADGAPEGRYQVVLVWREPTPDNAEEADTDKLLGWYGPVHSKLTAEVTAGPTTLPPIKLPAVTRPPTEVQGIPGKN